VAVCRTRSVRVWGARSGLWVRMLRAGPRSELLETDVYHFWPFWESEREENVTGNQAVRRSRHRGAGRERRPHRYLRIHR